MSNCFGETQRSSLSLSAYVNCRQPYVTPDYLGVSQQFVHPNDISFCSPLKDTSIFDYVRQTNKHHYRTVTVRIPRRNAKLYEAIDISLISYRLFPSRLGFCFFSNRFSILPRGHFHRRSLPLLSFDSKFSLKTSASLDGISFIGLLSISFCVPS